MNWVYLVLMLVVSYCHLTNRKSRMTWRDAVISGGLGFCLAKFFFMAIGL